MCPAWSRVADEIESLARDRALAATVEPEPRERLMLEREAGLLDTAASFARSGPGDGHLVHTACEGVVVHVDHFVMWGISEQAEQELRRLAVEEDRAHGAADERTLLMAVLGVPPEDAPSTCGRPWTAPFAAAVAATLATVASVLGDAADLALPFV